MVNDREQGLIELEEESKMQKVLSVSKVLQAVAHGGLHPGPWSPEHAAPLPTSPRPYCFLQGPAGEWARGCLSEMTC